MLLVRHLCRLFCYQVIYFRACLNHVQYSSILKGQKILFWRFLVRLAENFLEFYLLLIGLFFLDGKDKQVKFVMILSGD